MIEVPGYRILAELGSGASGTVCLAVQESLGREVALKILAPGLFGMQETRARFLREAKLQAQLAHPNLLRLLDAGFVGSRPFLVTELVEGGTLRELLDSVGQLPLRETCRIGAEMAAGLASTHLAGIVHRDLKPENVLLTGANQAKLADFGLAKAVSALQTVETAQGVILGTPGYIAPEVVCDRPATAAADLYALGAILFEMAAGVRAFRAEAVSELLQLQLAGRVPSLAELRRDAPQALVQLVNACLQLQPELRPAASGVAGELLSLAAALDTEPGTRTVSMERPREASTGPNASAHQSGPGATGAVVSPRRRRGQAAGADAGRRGEDERSGATRRLSRSRQPAAASPTRPVHAASAPTVRVTAILAGALLIAAVLWASRDGRTRSTWNSPPAVSTAASVARLPADGKSPLALAPLVTVGPREAQLWWEAPLSTELPLACRCASRHQETRITAARGAVDVWLKGLEPASSYQLLVGTGPAEITTAFSTLPVAFGGRVTRLVTGECEGPELRSSGERVAVLWIRAGSAFRNVICLRESRDGGRTWGRIEEVSPVEYALEPELVYLEGGTCVGWLSQNRELLLTRYRPDGSRSWQPAVSIPSGGVLPPLAMCAADERLGAWVLTSVTLPDGTMRGRLLRWRLGPGGVPGLEDDPRNGSLPAAEYLRVLKTSAGLLALGTEADRGPVRSLLPARPDARWTPLLSVGGQSGRVRERFLDVAERAGQLLVAQEQVTSILLHSSSDGGATFQLAANLGATRANGLFLRPALTATADRFVLAACDYRLVLEASLRILISRDGRNWEDSTAIALDPLAPAAKLRAVVAGDRLLVLFGAERDWGRGLVSVPTAALRSH